MGGRRSLWRWKSWTESTLRMSLIELRRERRKQGGGPTRPPRTWKLILGLAFVVFMLWYLNRLA